jgi:hypothetical protein
VAPVRRGLGVPVVLAARAVPAQRLGRERVGGVEEQEAAAAAVHGDGGEVAVELEVAEAARLVAKEARARHHGGDVEPPGERMRGGVRVVVARLAGERLGEGRRRSGKARRSGRRGAGLDASRGEEQREDEKVPGAPEAGTAGRDLKVWTGGRSRPTSRTPRKPAATDPTHGKTRTGEEERNVQAEPGFGGEEERAWPRVRRC